MILPWCMLLFVTTFPYKIKYWILSVPESSIWYFYLRATEHGLNKTRLDREILFYLTYISAVITLQTYVHGFRNTNEVCIVGKMGKM